MGKDKAPSLFDKSEHDWFGEAWNGMPEFSHEDLTPHSTLLVHFKNEEDRKEFAKFVEQKLTYKTKSIWYPEPEKQTFTQFRYVTKDKE